MTKQHYQCQAEGYVTAVLALAEAKKATLKRISLCKAGLDVRSALRLIAAMPSGVELDLSEFGIANVNTEGGVFVDSVSLVGGLLLAKSPFVVLQWWKSMPRCILQLDLSDVVTTPNREVFTSLINSFRSLQAPIALRDFSIARIVAEPALPAFVQLLESVLLSAHIQIKVLDISGKTSKFVLQI